MYTTSRAFLEALEEAGVSYIFANLGSDHPAIIETLAIAAEENLKLPEVIIGTHEMVAMSAAHGYTQISGEAQALIMHVDVGTQNLGGAVHNAAKGRIPMLIFAGTSPFTQEGELVGSRNEHIHWLQDVYDQRGIVRAYTKYENEIRTGSNVKQLVHRSFQIANSDPKGPVYLTGAREVMEEETKPVKIDKEVWQPIASSAMQQAEADALVEELLKAKSPLIITSYLGRSPEAVKELVTLSEALAIPVVEAVPNYLNFPSNHKMHCGYQWNEQKQNKLLESADFILVLDSDIPWMSTVNKPKEGTPIYYIDVDPLKEKIPLWYIPAKKFWKVDSRIALTQINQSLKTRETSIDKEEVKSRRERVVKVHDELIAGVHELETFTSEVITAEYLTACLREVIDEDTVVLNETISNYGVVTRHLLKDKSGTLFASGASSLGWNGGAAIGMKLAQPDKTIVSLTGDGSYLFSVPSSVHWMAKTYETPFLTVIYNNRGWKSPKLSTLGVHPEGVAKRTNNFGTNFEHEAELADIAKASGDAYATKVENPNDLKEALRKGLEEVKNGRAAVIDVRIRKMIDEK